MCYHKLIEETTVINLTLRPTVNPLPVPNRNAVDLSGSLYMGEYFMLSMHLRQLFRKPARIIIFILILMLLTAFFCVSLNLYANSMHNLKLADETYTTIAVMELYADVDNKGNIIVDITKASNYAGYLARTVYGYDLQPIISAPSVKKYELRARYGAYSEANIAIKEHEGVRGLYVPFYKCDVLRFKLNVDDNTILDPYNPGQYITPNFTEKGFALPDSLLVGNRTYADPLQYITFALDITGSATDGSLTADNRPC